jgi:hypothetical protein
MKEKQMKYFEMIEDSRIHYRYKIENLQWEEIDGKNIGIGYFTGEEEALPDFISYKKLFLVSLDLKNVLEMYADEIEFNLVMLNNIEAKAQREYYVVKFPSLEGLHESSTYNKDNSVKHIVLSHKKIKDYKVFGLNELELTKFSRPHIFVDLDIVESALRRELWGMTFEETAVR